MFPIGRFDGEICTFRRVVPLLWETVHAVHTLDEKSSKDSLHIPLSLFENLSG